MSTPDDVKDLFGQLTTSYPTILGQPTDDDVKLLRETLTNLLQSIDIAGGTDSLSGLIDDDADYQAIYGHPFDMLLLAMPPYDPSIASDASDAVRVKAERVWTAKADRQRLIRATERLGRIFLTTVVEDTWLLPLKSSTTFYNKVPLQDMLQHLATSTAGLDHTDIVSLLVEMQTWWEADPRVPEYINKLEDAQKKAHRAGLPITNEWLVATASKSLLVAASFPTHRKDWDSLLPSSKTWVAWKKWAREAQLTVEREQRASGSRGDTFGSAAAAIQFHQPKTSSFGFAGGAFHSSASPSFEEQFASGMDALAAAATNEKTVLDNLVASNKTLSELTAKKIARIEELISARPSPPAATASPSDAKLVAQLRAAIKGKWVPGGFCSTHGYGVSTDHDSASCKNKKPGHVDTATRSSPAGHGHDKHINKGWDAFLSDKAPK
jgi:hypothetical protein